MARQNKADTAAYNRAYGKRYRKTHRRKARVYAQAYHQANKKKLAAQNRARKLASFGLSVAAYDARFLELGGLCAACRRPEQVVDFRTKKVRRLATDHNHRTGVFRDLLCSFCNRALGLLDDDTRHIDALAAYVHKHSLGRT